jgi:hypothetical protein
VPTCADHLGLLRGELRRDLGLASDGRDHGRVTAVVGDVLVGDPGLLGDRFHGVVAGGRQTGGGDRDLARFGLHGIEKLGHVLVGRIGIDANHGHVGNIQEQRPVLELGVQHAEDRIGAEVGSGARGPGVAVVRCIPGALGADRARGARLVDDHDALASASSSSPATTRVT